MLSNLFKAHDSAIENPYGQIDALFKSIRDDGNAFVRFRDFKSDDPGQIAFMTRMYFRGTYIAYQTRISVSPGNKVINNGRDIWKFNQEPTGEFIETNDVVNLVIFEFDVNSGELRSRIQSLKQ